MYFKMPLPYVSLVVGARAKRIAWAFFAFRATTSYLGAGGVNVRYGAEWNSHGL